MWSPSSILLRATLSLLLLITFSGCRGTPEALMEPPFPERRLSTSEPIDVVVWNIQKAKHPELPEELEEVIRERSIDLALTQEARRDLSPPEHAGASYAESWHLPWPGTLSVGVRTYSRTAPNVSRTLPSPARELLITTPKVSLATTHPVDRGEPLLVINSHLLNFEVFGTRRFRSQLTQLESVIESHTGPILLAGDFNTWSSTRLELLNEMTRRHGLREVTEFPPLRKTGDLGMEWLHRLLGIDAHLPLDRVYLRGATLLEADVLGRDSSDHLPLFLRIQLKASE